MAYAMGRTPTKLHQGHTEFDLDDSLLADMEEPVDVRRLTGEWEKELNPTSRQKTVSPPLKTKTTTKTKQPLTKLPAAKMTSLVKEIKVKDTSKEAAEPKSSSASRRPSVDAGISPGKTGAKYLNRLTEAKAMMAKVRLQLNSSRNTSRTIIKEVMDAAERLVQIVGEAEADRKADSKKGITKKNTGEEEKQAPNKSEEAQRRRDDRLMEKIDENNRILKENEVKMEELKKMVVEQTDKIEKLPLPSETTYANVVAEGKKPHNEKKQTQTKSLHSLVVTSKDVMETGEEVLERIRKAADAKEGWIKVEKVRKAKDSKIIMGCYTKEDRKKIKEKLEKAGQGLVVEDMRNRDPLLVLKGVLTMHSDEEVVRALRNQNRELFHGLEGEEDRVAVKFRRKTRNPHTNHIVVTVSPTIWGRATEQGRLRIDLQYVFVEDQSPLIQCSKCLGYGHGRKFCSAPEDLCSHCGGMHHSKDCQDRVQGTQATCVNCKKSSSDKMDHNAFSSECPVRRKWDKIARSSTQYHC